MTRKMTRKWKIIAVIVIALIITVVAVNYIVQWANSPSNQPVTITTTTTQPAVIQNQTLSTDFFTTAIPSDFKVQVNKNQKDPTMVQVSAFQAHGVGTQIGITTAPLTSEGLTGVASYLYRIRNHQLYEQIPNTVFPNGSTTFRALTGDGEVTAFLVNSGRYASVAVSGGGTNNPEIDSLITVIAKTWKWL